MKKSIIYLLSATALLGLSSCSNVDEPLDAQQELAQQAIITNQQAMQDYLNSLKTPGVPEGTRALPPSITDEHTEQIPGEDNGVPGYWVVTKKHYKASQLFDETIVLDPHADILYPGCVLSGKSIDEGSYTPVTEAEVGDITFSINKPVADGVDPSAIRRTIFNPRLSEYRTVFNEWAGLHYKQGAVTSIHSLESVTSKNEVMAKIGAAFGNQDIDIAANLGFDFDKQKTHILAKFIQKQFTVTTDFPKTPTIFTSINPMIIREYAPVYVSNLTYGRMIFMSVDTNHSLSEVRTALNFAVKAIDLKIDLESQYQRVLDESDIKVTIIGGGQGTQKMALNDGWAGFKEYMNRDVEMQELTPISFSLRYAKDNSVCRVINNGEYDVVNRSFVPEFKTMNIEIALSGIKGKEGSRKVEFGNEFEIYGKGWATFDGKPIGDLFNIGRKNYYVVKKGDAFTKIDGTRGVLSLTKGDNESFADFCQKRIRFYTHMRDYDARIIEKNDKDYSETYQEFSIGDLLAKVRAGDSNFSVIGTGHGVCVETQLHVSNVTYR